MLQSFFPWRHEYPSTAHGLARALAAYTRVWFVSKPPTWKDALRQRDLGRLFAQPRVERVALPRLGGPTDATTDAGVPFGKTEPAQRAGSLHVVKLAATPPINGLAPGSAAYERLRGFADRRMSRQLASVLRGAGTESPLWINLYAPTQLLDLGDIPAPARRLYYTVDAIGEADYTARHGVSAEVAQARRADLVLATSARLAEHARERLRATGVERRVEVVPNAVDAELYLTPQRYPEPDDLADIPHPRAVYVGNLDAARIDFELLERLARERPDLHLVLVGPVNAAQTVVDRALALPNVHALGRKDQRACPAYLQHVDLGLIPFRLTDLTAAIYPLKINEYLAIGKPVLATPFSKDIADFRDNITLAPIDQWAGLIEEVVEAHTPERAAANVRRGADNDWASRARTFLGLAGYAVEAAPVETPVA